MSFHSFEIKSIRFFRSISVPLARFGLFFIFFWSGLLNILGYAGATYSVQNFYLAILPGFSFSAVIVFFGCFQCLTGLFFLIPGFERTAIPLLLIQLIVVVLPIIFVPSEMWASLLVPTLLGQYFVKDAALIIASIGIASHLHPLKLT